jgi:hypothetical protein
VKKKTIADKYSDGSMSHFEKKVYEYQEDVIQNIHIMHTKTIISLTKEVRRLQQKVADTCPRCGCTELLCGYNGIGCCTPEENKNGN